MSTNDAPAAIAVLRRASFLRSPFLPGRQVAMSRRRGRSIRRTSSHATPRILIDPDFGEARGLSRLAGTLPGCIQRCLRRSWMAFSNSRSGIFTIRALPIFRAGRNRSLGPGAFCLSGWISGAHRRRGATTGPRSLFRSLRPGGRRPPEEGLGRGEAERRRPCRGDRLPVRNPGGRFYRVAERMAEIEDLAFPGFLGVRPDDPALIRTDSRTTVRGPPARGHGGCPTSSRGTE